MEQDPDVNVSDKLGSDEECAISKNPTNRQQLFVACNADSGLFVARSNNGGDTWMYPNLSKTIADGGPDHPGAPACCDPSLAWESFGNLYLTYLSYNAYGSSIETLISIDGGQNFQSLASFSSAALMDQPTVVAADIEVPVGDPPRVALMIVWYDGEIPVGRMAARAAEVTGSGLQAVSFLQAQSLDGTLNCSFGDVAIAPSGAVVQVCQEPASGQDGRSTIL